MSTTLDGKPAPKAFQPVDAEQVDYLQRNAVFFETERFKKLDRRHAFFKALEYQHQDVDWFDMQADNMETISAEAVFPAGTVPAQAGEKKDARQKRPTAPTRRARVTTMRFTNLLFSDKRAPKVTVDQDEDTAAFLDAVRRKAKFWATMRGARNMGGAIGSVLVTVHLRDGKWSYEAHNTKFCTPLWKDVRDHSLLGVLKMYRTPRQVNKFNEKGEVIGVETVDFLNRRIITENDEIIYKEMPLADVLKDPAGSWVVEEGLSVQHNLGMFPGVWIQNSAEAEDEDGECDCEGAYQSIDTNDRLIAQMFYGTLGNCDPTVVTRTDPKQVQQVSQLIGLQKGTDHAIEVGASGDAHYMEMTGSGVETGLKLSDKIEAQTDVITGLVVPDDQTMAAAQSAEALELRFAPMLAKADDLRAQYGGAVIELMEITEAIARKFQSASVRLPNGPNGEERIGVYEFDLPPKKAKVDGGQGVMVDELKPHELGDGGYIDLTWGPYFAATENDKGVIIKNAAAANAAGFITKLTAARAVAPFFGVQDVEGEVAERRQEGEAEAEEAMAAALGGNRSIKMLAGSDESQGQAAGGRP